MTEARVRSHGAAGWFDGDGAEVTTADPSHPRSTVARLSPVTGPAVARHIEAGREARRLWRERPIGERGAVLRTAAALLAERADRIGVDLARDMGKPVREAVAEVRRASEIFAYHAAAAWMPVAHGYAGATGSQTVQVVQCPVGTIAVITPWNFPVAIPAWKIAPALVFGNGVVWKPSSASPLTAHRLMECLIDAGLPDGVVTCLHAPGRVASSITGHPDIDAVTFTGSTGIGRGVVRDAVDRGIPVQAELGGKNVTIVWEDADLDRAVAGVLTGGFSGNGQKCTATSRLILSAGIADDFLERLRLAVAGIEVGPAEDEGSAVGPLISAEARDAALRAIDEQGGRLVAEARVPAGATGWFLPPTVVELEAADGPLWREELFAPVVAVVRASDADEAIRLANDTEYGLAGAVYTQRRDLIARVVAELDVGMLSVNEPTTGGYPYVPFGGWRSSGHGPREQGESARQFFTRTKTVHIGL
ncbi:MAG: aldehyde dehydrogenase family protein [Microbacterium sp.]